MTTAETTSLPGRGIKPLVSLLGHPWLALAVFVAVLLAGIPVALVKGKAMYATTATLQVAPRYMKNLRDDGELSFPSNTQYREFLEHQKRSVLRYDIVQDALHRLGEQSGPWRRPGESERQAVERVRSQVAVNTVPDTYLIEVSLQAAQQEGLAELVNAIVGVYVERMKVERIYGADVRLRNVEAREAELLTRIAAKTEQRTGLALQLGIGNFDEKVENPYDRLLNTQRTLLGEARQRRFDAEARLGAFQTRGETDVTLRSVQEAVQIDPGLASLKSNLYKRRADLLSQISGLTADHPAYAELREEMQKIEAEIETQTGLLTRKVSGSVLARYQTTADQARHVEAELLKDLAELEKKGAQFASLYNQAMTLTLDIEQDRKELNLVRERLGEFAAEENSFGFIRLVTPALPPEVPFGPGRKKLLLLVLAAALFAGLAAPLAVDLIDRRVHTVNDVERQLGIPALGWMVESSDAATAIFGHDLLRRIAGSLIGEQQEHGTRVFAWSSVKPGAGTTELVLSLGRQLTALGYPALVVEANAFSPDARLRRDDRGAPGLAECLAGSSDPRTCIAPADDSRPATLSIGETGEARHLDRLDRLVTLSAEWQQDYRFILVDLPPLLLSADAEILARSLQHLVLVVEAAGTGRGELRRAARLVERIAPAAVGVVVNRVRPFAGGGYLRDLLVEHLSGRKASEFFSRPAWLLALRSQLAALPGVSWRPPRLLNRKR